MIALLAEGVPAECMVGTFNSHGWMALAVTGVGLVGAIYSLSKGFEWLREEADCKRDQKEAPDRRTAKNWLLGLWVLLPPAWFFIEYIFLYRHFGKPACFESFKYAQELAGKGWAGMVAVLSGLYFGKEILGKE
ncbi:hypothetical protein [Edaphobacter modestus]|uniref:Uncharacterized protein n=1 Tax=Edaphobacter modestus TaxID=388466 RepID=A0A4V2G4K4_9BACT|nr:hypothetical protein [Edaphobacter modestus]RZU41256.1 hypothetical protein BDD14_2763 [Edaphobacter modestus]